MRIQFLYYEDCPSHEAGLQRLKQVLAEEGVNSKIEIIQVKSEEEAQQRHFVGSPTILIDGQDIVPPPPGASYHLTCRAYQLENGRISPLPSVEMIRKALSAQV